MSIENRAMAGRLMRQEVTLSTQDSSLDSRNADRIYAKEITDQLIARIGAERFDLWFSDRQCIVYQQPIKNGLNSDSKNSILIRADNDFSLHRIQNVFGQEIRHVVDRVCGPHFKINYGLPTTKHENSKPENQNTSDHHDSNEVIPVTDQPASETATIQFATPNGQRNQSNATSAQSNAFNQRRLRGVNSFWFGPDNGLLKAGVDQMFEQPGQFSPFVVYGPTGCGKSHLLETVTNDFRRRLKQKRCVFLSAEQFTSQFVSSLRGGKGLPMFRRKYRDLDLLAIDDIQFLAGKRATLGEFQHTIDNLIRSGKQVIVASDRPPIELGHLGNDISARLNGGLTCPIQYPDFEGRMHIVRKMCADRKLKLSTSVLQLICEQLSRDVRRLSGALNRLHACSVSIGEPITPEFAKKNLCDLFSMTGTNCTSLVSIEQAVCEFCGVQPMELKSPSRQKRISSARMLAMYLSRQYTGSAFSEIGDYFGGRSHSTVIAAERKVAKWIENDDGIAMAHAVYPAKEVVRRIESNLRIG
jgi:chromosomal replication initiator protein